MVRQGSKPASPADAIHIVHGLWRPADARDVVVLRDSLNLGPCHTNPEVHGAGRSEYWLSFEQDIAGPSSREPRIGGKAHRDEPTSEILASEQLIAALTGFPESLPIVLWVSSTLGDRLTFWWMLDAFARSSLATARCWVADSRYPEDEPSALEFADVIRPLTQARSRRGVSLWIKYASPSPVALDQARRSKKLEAVDTQVISDLQLWALPRLIDGENSCLRLSEFDQLLLGRLDDQNWVRPYDVLVSVLNESQTHPALLHFGDRVFSQRFSEWARHQPDEPSLVSQPVPGGVNSLTRVAYRLTPRGRRIVNVGLDDPAEAPEFHVGGCRVYRGTPVWARHIVGSEWRVKRWK